MGRLHSRNRFLVGCRDRLVLSGMVACHVCLLARARRLARETGEACEQPGLALVAWLATLGHSSDDSGRASISATTSSGRSAALGLHESEAGLSTAERTLELARARDRSGCFRACRLKRLGQTSALGIRGLGLGMHFGGCRRCLLGGAPCAVALGTKVPLGIRPVTPGSRELLVEALDLAFRLQLPHFGALGRRLEGRLELPELLCSGGELAREALLCLLEELLFGRCRSCRPLGLPALVLCRALRQDGSAQLALRIADLASELGIASHELADLASLCLLGLEGARLARALKVCLRLRPRSLGTRLRRLLAVVVHLSAQHARVLVGFGLVISELLGSFLVQAAEVRLASHQGGHDRIGIASRRGSNAHRRRRRDRRRGRNSCRRRGSASRASTTGLLKETQV
mmetsp:Transcript_6233/g.25000  ORF Transcript_6233/g.25000 Transcript_6233/m.25000 type:complete len:402 (+) Transcript_6233:3164-4369(+)